MKKQFIKAIKKLNLHTECTKSHEPNDITKQALENVKKQKGLQKAPADTTYLKALEATLSEWDSQNDETDYSDIS